MAKPWWRNIIFSLSLITQVGLVIAASIVVGLLLGRWLDGLLGLRVGFALLGTVFGVGAGLFSAFRLLRSALKDDKDGNS